MKVLVPVKRVPDVGGALAVAPDGSGIVTDRVKWILNPFDEIAIEEALRIREQGIASEVVLVSIGAESSQEQLRSGLALGADRAMLVAHDGALDSLVIARLLARIVDQEAPALVLLGKQAVDDDAAQVGPMLAELLGWPQATCASKVEVSGGACVVVREVDAGLETVAFDLPGIVTTDLRLNQPRYATLPGLMKAKRKPIETIPAAELGVDLTPRARVIGLAEIPRRTAGRIVDSVEELVRALRDDAKAI